MREPGQWVPYLLGFVFIGNSLVLRILLIGMRRRVKRPATLTDLLARDITRDPRDAPAIDVQDAVLAQDMAWVEDQLRVDHSPEQRRQQTEHHDRQHA
jgi:hypothetical protein